MDEITLILLKQNIRSHLNQGILIANVTDAKQGLNLAEDILGAILNPQTFLLLSGGRTPKELYSSLAVSETLNPGAVGMIDERFGPKGHPKSNEKMIGDTGLLRYFEMRGIPFYPILLGHPERSEGSISDSSVQSTSLQAAQYDRSGAADAYDMKLRELQHQYQKSVGILGIGLDGHTAGIPAGKKATIDNEDRRNLLVTAYHDTKGTYGERVTMTFLGLEHIDLFIVLVFGNDKQEALNEVFSHGKEEEIPGRFYTRSDIAPRTVIITDQLI